MSIRYPQYLPPGAYDSPANLLLALGFPGVRQAAMAPYPQPPHMAMNVDLGDYNNPPPMSGHGGFSENAAPYATGPALPLPPAYSPPPRQMMRPAPAASRGGQMSADDLNALSLAAARGEQMPVGANADVWNRIRGR